MPYVIVREWQDFSFAVRPHDSLRNKRIPFGRHSVLPYFYGTFVGFDLIFIFTGVIPPNRTISYKWSLIAENKEIDQDPEVFKKGEGIIDAGILASRIKRNWLSISPVQEDRKLKEYILTDRLVGNAHTLRITKQNAIYLGLLSCPTRYTIKLKLTDEKGETSPIMIIQTFTVMDRDKSNLSTFYAVIGALVGGLVTYFVMR